MKPIAFTLPAIAIAIATTFTAGIAIVRGAHAESATSAPLAEVAQATDLAKGKAQFARCAACHSIAAGGPKRIGPGLNGVVGRAAGKQAGFRYTPAMAGANFVWTRQKLDAFLEKPRAVVPGTSMVFAGMPDPAARKALIDYLAQAK